MLYSEMTDKIINSFYKVYNVLGYGFLEKVYENQIVGDYFADIIVNDLIILEIKAAEGLRDENKAQLINYLKLPINKSGFCLISVKNQISKERSSPMKEGKYQKQKLQIRVNLHNPRHPRSIRLDEYYFLNPDKC